MRGTPRFVAGSRFKYTPDYIDFNYQALVDAIGDAIDKQAEEDGEQYFTEEASNLHITVKEFDFDELKLQFEDLITSIMSACEIEAFNNDWQPRITQIIETYLGKGMKVSQCTRDQVEALDLIVTDLKELVKINNINRE